MPRLPFQAGAVSPFANSFLIADKPSQKFRLLTPGSALIVAPDRFGYRLSRQIELAGQKVEQELRQSRQRNAICPPNFFEKPIAELQELPERRTILAPKQRRALHKIAAVADEVPISREAA